MTMDYVRTGKVDWTGDNPPIYLKTDPNGEWSTLALFFRVNGSDLGRGHMILVLEDPYGRGIADPVRLCCTDNAPLARYLLDDFVRKFGLFRPAQAAIDALEIVPRRGLLGRGGLSPPCHRSRRIRRPSGQDALERRAGDVRSRTAAEATARPAATRCFPSSSLQVRPRSGWTGSICQALRSSAISSTAARNPRRWRIANPGSAPEPAIGPCFVRTARDTRCHSQIRTILPSRG
jgi:hypothetical protein